MKITTGSSDRDRVMLTQYLRSLRTLYESVIEDNIDSFQEEFLSDLCDTILETWFCSRSVLIVCATDNGAKIEEEIPLEDFIEWMIKTEYNDDKPEETA